MIFRALLIAVAFGAAPAWAEQSPAQAALAAVDQLSAAATQLEQATAASDQVAALTETVRGYESGMVALRDGLRRVAIRQQVLEAELDGKRDAVARLLGVLETMGRAPAPLLLLHPSGPTGTARSGMMLAEVTPALQAEVDRLRDQLEEVQELRQVQDGAAETLRRGLDGAQQARAALSAAIQDRTDLPLRFAEDPVQTALLLASTETLDAFASGLAETVGALPEDAMPPADQVKGALRLPVPARIVWRFNEEDLGGMSRPGVVLGVQPRSLVTTPVAATIRFRGPLLDFGNVIILEPAADVMIILAGLAEVFGEAGQVLPPGAPIGLMGGEVPPVDEILTETTQGGSPRATESLYLEVREGQSPVDPATWFALE